ncbi:MAG: hypothetical protein EBX99_00175 [Acidimicrobiia bacterium]|nr:hypothetical protein [Acidimicrobiia bacterium]
MCSSTFPIDKFARMPVNLSVSVSTSIVVWWKRWWPRTPWTGATSCSCRVDSRRGARVHTTNICTTSSSRCRWSACNAPKPDGTTLVCTLHGWKFDLETGRCLTAEDRQLRVRRAES